MGESRVNCNSWSQWIGGYDPHFWLFLHVWHQLIMILASHTAHDIHSLMGLGWERWFCTINHWHKTRSRAPYTYEIKGGRPRQLNKQQNVDLKSKKKDGGRWRTRLIMVLTIQRLVYWNKHIWYIISQSISVYYALIVYAKGPSHCFLFKTLIYSLEHFLVIRSTLSLMWATLYLDWKSRNCQAAIILNRCQHVGLVADVPGQCRS